MPINRIKYRDKIYKRQRKGSEDLTEFFMYCLIMVVFASILLMLMSR